jgi:hypothetical protein
LRPAKYSSIAAADVAGQLPRLQTSTGSETASYQQPTHSVPVSRQQSIYGDTQTAYDNRGLTASPTVSVSTNGMHDARLGMPMPVYYPTASAATSATHPYAPSAAVYGHGPTQYAMPAARPDSRGSSPEGTPVSDVFDERTPSTSTVTSTVGVSSSTPSVEQLGESPSPISWFICMTSKDV